MDNSPIRNSILSRGCYLYSKKDYSAAVKNFTKVIDTKWNHELLLFKALDCRAACYEKLDDFSKALRDAKQMIKVMPNSSKGYLRSGKILCLQSQKNTAIKIYKRGLEKSIDDADKGRDILQSMHDKLKIELGSGKKSDPFCCLPLELMHLILHSLEIRHLVVCLAVSKTWKKQVESFRNLWTTLDLIQANSRSCTWKGSYSSKPIQVKQLRVYLRRSNYNLERAFIHTNLLKEQQKVKCISDGSSSLKEIQIHGHGRVNKALVDLLSLAKKLEKLYVADGCFLSVKAMLDVLRVCQNTLVGVCISEVTKAHIGYVFGIWPSLENLKIVTLRTSDANIEPLITIKMDKFMQAAPNITSVTLINIVCQPVASLDFTAWLHLERLHLQATGTVRFPRLGPNIRHLFLEENQIVMDGDEENSGLFSLPLLETVSFRSTKITARDLILVTKSCIEANNLKCLLLRQWQPIDHSHNFGIFPPIWAQYPSSLTLESLSITNVIMDDRHAMEIIGLYPRLKRIDLSYTTISGVTIKALVKKGGVIYIRIEGCSYVGIDAIDWARSEGVEVLYRTPSPDIIARSGRERVFSLV